MGRLMIACGGTGGHLFPGLAVAEAVRRRGHEVKFFISAKEVDRRALAGAGESAHAVEIPAVGWRGVFRAGSFVLNLLAAVKKAGEAIREFRADALLGMGGFVSGASIGAARKKRFLIFSMNRMQSRGEPPGYSLAEPKKSLLAFRIVPTVSPGAQTVFTGTPVRQRLGGMGKGEALQKLGLHPKRHLVAVLGGSQGAKGLNEAMIRGLGALKEEASTMQILHLAGEAHAEKVRKAYQGSGFHAVVMGFCDAMEAVYAAADLVVARSGAGTLAELATCGVPAILVPFPAALDDHQMANAHAYADGGAAEVVAEKYLVGTELGQRVARLLGDASRRSHMSKAARAQAVAQAAEKIAEEIQHVL